MTHRLRPQLPTFKINWEEQRFWNIPKIHRIRHQFVTSFYPRPHHAARDRPFPSHATNVHGLGLDNDDAPDILFYYTEGLRYFTRGLLTSFAHVASNKINIAKKILLIRFLSPAVSAAPSISNPR